MGATLATGAAALAAGTAGVAAAGEAALSSATLETTGAPLSPDIFNTACVSYRMSTEASRLVQLRDRLIVGIQTEIPNAYMVGHRYKRLPGHICLGFAGQEGEAIKLMLSLNDEGIAISTGSACSSHHAGQPSYILMAMGMDPVRARGSLRITLGRFNTEAEVDTFLEVLPRLVGEMRPVTSRSFATA